MRKTALLLLGLVVMGIVALGLLILSSASAANASRLHGGDVYFFLKRQSIYIVAGVVVAVCVALFDYRRWRECEVLTWSFFVIVAMLLVGVLFTRAINGSHRWFSVGPISLQPSEFAKIAIVIALSVWFDKLGWRVELFTRGALMPFLLICVLAIPVMREPDFGSTLVIFMSGVLVMLLAGVRIMHLLPFVLMGGAVIVVKIMTNANRMARLAAWFGVHAGSSPAVMTAKTAAAGANYQAYNALVAIGNGGIWGVGLGESMQKHFYLPEAHTDFIFAVGAEELGLFFSIGAILLFCLFYGTSLYIARKASDRFGRYIVVGMASLIFAQAMVNVGVVCSAFPTKGLALPFFSYGGTNMISAFFAVGMIFSVGVHALRDKRAAFARKVLMRS